ncbi:MAG: hypothetical protein WAK90_04130 [Pseudolabrys sp.]
MDNTPHQQHERIEDDLLRGAAAIAEHLRSEGLNVTPTNVYYFAKAKKLPIGRWGKELIASKTRLSRELQRAAKADTREKS